MDLLASPEWRLAVAFAIGLVIGADRERHAPHRAAGVRTFALVGLLGGVLGRLGSPALTVLAGTFVAGAALVGYVMEAKRDPGLTSEVALMLTYVSGVLAIEQPALALGIGVAIAATLAFRTPIHRLVKETVTTRELLAGLQFAVAAVVIWPLLPDRAMGPMGALNPHTLWRLVVLVMAVAALGDLAQRLLGNKLGLTVAGLAGGFVSSAATVHAMGTRAREDAAATAPAAAAAAASTVATYVQMAVLVAAASPPLMRHAGVALALGGGAALVYAVLLAVIAQRRASGTAARGEPLTLKAAVVFAAVVSGVVLLSRACERWLGAGGVLLAAGVGGLADAHAAGSSVASIHGAGTLGDRTAVAGVLVALSTNSLTKIALAFSSGPRGYAVRVALGVVVALGAAWVGMLFA